MTSRMMGYRLASAALTLMLLACADRRALGDSEAIGTTAAANPAALPASAVAPSLPYYLDPTEDCGFLKVNIFPEPVALVRHYVALDNEAMFLESTPAMDSVYACPAHLPGPDEFTVVSGSTIELLAKSDSVAKVLVRSTRLGTMSQDSLGLVFIGAPGTAIDTFVVLNTPFGWRIESPQLPNRVLGATVLAQPERFKLRSAVRDTLSAISPRPDT